MDYEDESYKLPPESSRLVNAATCTAMALDREVRVYKRRWIMLALFVLCAANITVHWMQFSIIANIVMKYYNVSSSAVNWTSMVYMAAYVLLVVPASWLMDKKGLRVTLACAAGLTAAGAWLKALSASPQRFPVALAGQALLGAAQVFVLGAPAAVAAAWFGPGQVSTATALGVFGIQVGAAVGFVIPPVAVQNHEDADDIGSDLLRLYLGLAAGPSILLLLILLVFQAAPPIPPSPAEASVKSQEKKPAFSKTLGSLLTNKDFMLLLLSYGANMGAFNATSTLLNQILLTYFEGDVRYCMRHGSSWYDRLHVVIQNWTHRVRVRRCCISWVLHDEPHDGGVRVRGRADVPAAGRHVLGAAQHGGRGERRGADEHRRAAAGGARRPGCRRLPLRPAAGGAGRRGARAWRRPAAPGRVAGAVSRQ
ncbi:uncharacterized MFS-type transporter C09D4.1-like isoform X2 [Bacillus rossius redtenbacheri]|uniref:uncharacterized MFS-type transporter C09D4.1-like isoform X2 n=1 Tax=Bacillus rossius redtenbacheri TaxID=93214 RepID=UPI002FDEB06F